jgi:hypothetical protein
MRTASAEAVSSCRTFGDEAWSQQPTWPLQRWGLDLLGPLPPAQGNLRYVVVAVEYFSKWIEAKPLATITSVTVQKFF